MKHEQIITAISKYGTAVDMDTIVTRLDEAIDKLAAIFESILGAD